MLRLLALIFAILFCYSYSKECYVTPCTRDVIIMVDGSLSMKNTDYINQEISFVNKLIDGWTLANDKVRVAVVGAYFANEFQSSPYLTTRKDALNRLERYRVSATQYGLYDGTFSTCVSFLESVYMGQKALYGPRENIQKRIIIFTAHNDPVDVASTKDSLQRFADNGFAVTIVGIGSLQPVYSLTKYHRFVNLSLANMASGNQAIINDIIDNGVCFLSPGFTTPKPEICTTSTTQKPTTTTSAKRDGTTRKPVRPTHPPQIVGDYQNCSCHLDTLYLDIVFVVDNSKAMTDMGLVLVKAEIATIVGQMNIDPSTKQHSEIGLITYNAEAEIVFEPTHFTDVDDFNEALYEDPRLEHVSNNVEVNLVVGLEKAADMLGNMRRGVHKAVIIYASAYKDDGDATHIADQIKESGYDIITIAYVEPDESILVEKIGELASPRMNLTSYRDDLLVDEIEDALCQVNCYCPNQWTQLIIDGRRFSECFFEVQIDANWISSRYACEALSKLNHTGGGHVVYVNSELKQQYLNDYFMKHWNEETQENPNYDIGYYYDENLKKFVWLNGVIDSSYTNWDNGHPNLSLGKCSYADQVDKVNNIFKWKSSDCIKEEGRAICQETACDTDYYCTPV
ncbi:unnamed protein product [Caenorhabditis bovis]|uniref:C-type lectin domain-containing protein n=1 Tax=Caenorhabditis bovis TaxID=2654633 RepID=A0A8S1EPB9_9PELO|nr:unnamed protein product [Caenorhabditis bovis]